jgi:asparagine synthase (glutamine-hydrolysing)
MALLAGALFFDGRSVDDECHTLTSVLANVASDGVTTCVDGGLVMVHGAIRVWADDGAQCLRQNASRTLTLAWDGRLDNRRDLLLELGSLPASERSDAVLALAIYERWGVDGLRRLIGDWSVAIWNARDRTLSLARDYMGVRPLYYCRDAASVRWSSSLGELALRAGRVDALDDRFIARFMAWRVSTDVTPYRGIRAVPTAQCVSITSTGSESVQRFWRLDPGSVRYRDPRAYEERLRELWWDAVTARLRSPGTIWAELSGGLDSSSVVCMASVLIRDARVCATALQPISHVSTHSPEGDERRFIAEVERRIAVSTQTIPVEATLETRDAESSWVTPSAPRGVRLAAARHVQERGGRVILSGGMGDAIMGCAPDNSLAVFDELADWRLLTALARIRSWSRATRKPFASIAFRLAGETLRRFDVSRIDLTLNHHQRAGIALLSTRLRALAVESAAGSDHAPRPRLSRRKLARMVLEHSISARFEAQTPTGIVYAYPYTHRPLVEYMLAIPGEQLSAPGQTRALMRRAFKGLVPARVLGRFSKGYYPPVMTRGARARAGSLLPVSGLEVVRRGWIDATRLDAAIASLIGGGGRTSAEVRLVLQLEEWLTSRNRRALVMLQGKEVTTDGVHIA